MERHAQLGYELLAGSQSELLRLAATIAWTHHERFDGTGYPRGLAGEEIPVEGRIAALADVFDALLSDRSYRPALTLPEAVELIRLGNGTHFDPQLVALLVGHLVERDRSPSPSVTPNGRDGRPPPPACGCRR